MFSLENIGKYNYFYIDDLLQINRCRYTQVIRTCALYNIVSALLLAC